MGLNPNKRINYCLVDDSGIARVVIVIKWEKGNLYFVNPCQPWKASYHSPRNGTSQVHLKVNNSAPFYKSFEDAVENIRGFRMMNGAAMPLRELPNLPEAREKNGENYILDTRGLNTSRLAQIQWTHYLVEPNNENDLNELLAKYEANSIGMSERIAIHKLTDSVPWIVTVFTRICDEDPRWYEGLPVSGSSGGM